MVEYHSQENRKSKDFVCDHPKRVRMEEVFQVLTVLLVEAECLELENYANHLDSARDHKKFTLFL